LHILVVDSDMSKLGGGRVVTLEAIRALRMKGWDVTLLTSIYNEELLGPLPRGVELIEIGRGWRRFKLYRNMLCGFLGRFIECDLAIYTYGSAFSLPSSRPTLVYVHFPTMPYDKREAKWRLYSFPLHLNVQVTRRFSKRYYYYLTNSSFTAWTLRRRLGVAPLAVLHPPVRCIKPLRSKEDIIITIGRISPDKRQIEQLIAARKLKKSGLKFHMFIIGSLNRSSRKLLSYYYSLLNLRRRLGIEDCVDILTDLPRKELEDIVSHAKVLLHTYRVYTRDLGWLGEHFGIAIVESMSAGVIPIVPRLPSGVWWDVLERGRYGFGFSTLEEAAKRIISIMRDWEEYEGLSQMCMRRAGLFSRDLFAEKLYSLVECVSRVS